MAWTTQWRRHPGVRKHEELSVGERAADHMRNTMGSWIFVFSFFTFMIIWAVLNSVLHAGGCAGCRPSHRRQETGSGLLGNRCSHRDEH